MKVTAHIEKQEDGYWRAVTNVGTVIVRDESYQVASNYAWAYNHPEKWEPTEAYDVVERMKR